MKKTMLNGEWTLCYGGIKQLVQVPDVLERYLPERDVKASFHFIREFTFHLNEVSRYFLHCKGISCYATIFINHLKVQEVEGIWTDHQVEVGSYLCEGRNHIEIIVEKPTFDPQDRYYFRSVLFGFIPDVLFPFSGIFKDIYIEEKSALHLENVQIYFDYQKKELVIESNPLPQTCTLIIELEHQPDVIVQHEESIHIKLLAVKTWNPEKPTLYHIKISLYNNEDCLDVQEKVLGYRQIEIHQDEILMNKQPVFFRGILHWGYYPEDFQIVPNKETARRELCAIRKQGFNAVKFCLFLPPDYYYDLCDELGILVWQELPLWLPYDNGYLFDRIHRQYPEIMRMIKHHPSLFMISIGCELDATIPKATLDTLYDMITGMKTQAIVCDNSGSGECYDGALYSESDIYDYHFYGEIHNMQKLIHEFKHDSREKKPWFFGEFNDMDTFRDLNEVKEKSNYELFWADPDKKKNLLRYVHANAVSDMPIYVYDHITKENDILRDKEALIKCANQKAYDVRKYNLETTRINQINGYSITALRDVPITSCGIFDDFSNQKWSNDAMCSINGEIVVSMRAPLKRKWYHGADVFETLDEYNFYEDTMITNRVFISNHTKKCGPCQAVIRLSREDVNIQEIRKLILFPYQDKELFQLQLKLPCVTQTQRWQLGITILMEEEQLSRNQWDIWIYPKQIIQVQLFDPGNALDGIEEVMQVKRIHEFDELVNQPLVTTVLNEALLLALPAHQALIYLQNGEGYFPLQREPFWRECVRLIKSDSFFDLLDTKGYDSLQFLGVAGDMGIAPDDILKKTDSYERIMSRIDHRRFHRSECVFRFQRAGHDILVCTLNMSRASGTQARSFVENIFAQNLLAAMIKEQEAVL